MSTSELEMPPLPAGGKGRKDRSRDIMASMEGRLAKVELAITDMHDRVEELDLRMKKFMSEGVDEELHGKM